MGWRVALTATAERDFGQIVAFIAEVNPQAAGRVGAELRDLAFSLDQFPNRGIALPRRKRFRRLVHSHYLIIYRPDVAEQMVEIVRIWDGRQNPRRLKLT